MSIQNLTETLARVCSAIAMGDYNQAHKLFRMTSDHAGSPVIGALAEAFGMMLVKVEAREFRLEQIIEELQETTEQLEHAKRIISKENSRLRRDLRSKYTTVNMIGSSPAMRHLHQQIERVADAPVTVLVAGETGTGKELVAKALHFQSERAGGPYVPLNCSAIPDSLLESELFGIEKGVASGVDARVGRFQQADGGTLFLDEIGDMPLESQAKILRVIESGEVERVGGRTTKQVDVRIVAATHKNLMDMVKKGTFREDLYYRLSVIRLEIPPLRERPEDIPLLARFFLKKAIDRMRTNVLGFSPDALCALSAYDWPGNVRQLENEVERAVVLSLSEAITPADFSPDVAGSIEGQSPSLPLGLTNEVLTLEEGERILIHRALEKTDNNKSEAARLLGISREGLRKKLNRLGELGL